ncbi:MAG: MMPL family transporter [Bdellovibrionales bacterium]|nr:MMPL family transporter [Bdellovibrionales bacterium]
MKHTQHFYHRFEKFLLAVVDHPWWSLVIVTITLIPSLYLCFQLSLKSDFKTLLPQKTPSVITLNQLVQRVGGLGSLIIAIESKDIKATEHFIEDLVIELKKMPPKYVRFLEYNIEDVKKFYTDHKYFYIGLEDLKKIEGRLKKKIEYEKLKQNPFFFEIDEDKVSFDLSDIEKKYEGETSSYDHYVDGYFFSKDQNLAVILIQPYGTATGVDFSKKLLEEVQSRVNHLDPSSYHPSLKVTYRGKYKKVLTQYSQTINDIVSTVAICFFLVALSLFFYFYRLRVIFLLAFSLGVGVAWTFGLSKLVIGYLNSQTAFLGSIIIGNGVNTGILLFAAYYEERKKGLSSKESLQEAILQTYKPTFIAAFTTSIAFAALGFSQIKGLSHFGFIGGIGMLFCWISSFIFLPALTALCDQIYPMIKTPDNTPSQWKSFFQGLYTLIERASLPILSLGMITICVSLYLFFQFIPQAMEYDFSKLKTNFEVSEEIRRIDRKMKEIFPDSLTPSILLIPKNKETGSICEEVMHKEDAFPESERTIASCSTLDSYLPEQQDEKMAIHKDIRKLLDDGSIGFLEDKYKNDLKDFKKAVNLDKVETQDLPMSIRRKFQELDGTAGKIVYVFPKHNANLNNGKKLIQFSDALSNVRLDDQTTVRMSGESAIFADLLRAIKRDGPLTTLISFIFVSIFIFLNLRNLSASIYVLSGLLLGMIIMFGIESWLDIKLNFFNFIALPVTFGIGVDYSVNVYLKYRRKNYQSVQKTLYSLGGAVALCSITTIIGYISLTQASSQALASFGWLALIGEISCILSGLLFMPAVLYVLEPKNKK